MEVLAACLGYGTILCGQACCWYTLFANCGCLDNEYRREVIYTQSPPPKPPNPFTQTGVSKDTHLQSAYG